MNSSRTLVSTDNERHELIVRRSLGAPRELVWEGWTTSEHVARWWGIKGWPVTYCTLDLRPGGLWRYCLTGPNGEENWVSSVYREIERPRRLVYTNTFTDAQGNPIEGAPSTNLVTVTFDGAGDFTEVTVRFGYATEADLQFVLSMGMTQGFSESLDNLAQLLSDGL